MADDDRPTNPLPLTLLAAAGLAWALIAVAIAVLSPHEFAFRPFRSQHFQHFLAFYGLGVLSTAGLPTVKLKWIFLALALGASLSTSIRYFIFFHSVDVAKDWLYEMAGGTAALFPILVGMHRQSFAGWMSQPTIDDGDDGRA